MNSIRHDMVRRMMLNHMIPSLNDRDGPPPMTGGDFDCAIRSRGFTQVSFAKWVGVTDRVVRAWVHDRPPPHVVRLVQLMLAIYPQRLARRQRNAEKSNIDVHEI